MLSGKEQQLLKMLEEQAASHGIEIVTVEVIGSSRAPVVRVYIDTPDGVSFKELTDAQEWIGTRMDEVDPFPGAYTLEVSSPGIDRPLRTPAHFKRFMGETVKVRTTRPMDGQANFTGEVTAVSDDAVMLSIDGEERKIPFETIKRAHLVGKIDF